MEITKDRYHLRKGATGQLDDIYHIQGVLPHGSWDMEDGDPNSDRYVMLKTVTLDIKLRVV